MAVAAKKADYGAAETQNERIRIILCSRNVKSLERVCANIVKDAKENELNVKGPVRMPTKVLKITTRKSPCGEGTNTWDRFEMRIHKRVINFYAQHDKVKLITKVALEANVVVDAEFLR
ncbi:hypothetical protein NDN08_008196 [Rhodosorus marinus]|uniref:Small ribosomal subunit protein uS10 n=1 Tax=Rhodosorus marinus TaxID=101924 RepID=A0AAV8V2J1_9RHOD|nr:hypothetical protein NDN08_008196 [Rhodosorus marinus]